MEAFLAVQALCGGENSDSESIRSDISETFGALSVQRRPGSGRRKKQAPWRSPWAASVSTDYAQQNLPKDHEQSRLGITAAELGLSSPVTPTAVAAEPDPVNTPNVPTPNNANRKKTRQDLAGPCCHCSATNSPQWRKGPKGKPILCNACGIRFLRTRTLGKAVPKKRRPPMLTAGINTIQAKRTRTDEPSTEDDELELATDEVLVTEDTLIATDDGIEEAHSGSLHPASLGLAGLSDAAAAAAAALGHHLEYPHQHAAIVMPTSRLAISSRAVEQLQEVATYGDAYAEQYQQYDCSADEQYAEQYTEQYAEQYAGIAAAAGGYHTAAGLFPEYGWPTTSLHPMGPAAVATAAVHGQLAQDSATLLAAAAAARTAGTASSSTTNSFGVNTPSVSTGTHQPLAAGSRLLLGGSSSGSSRLSHNPSLALALAMHQQQQYSSMASQQQQQPHSPMLLGVFSHPGVTGSPISQASVYHPHLAAEYSGFSVASGSTPASPLLLGAAAGSSNLQHMLLSSKGSGGISSALCTQQQQQLGLHGPSPLSVMATAADVPHAAVMSAADVAAAPYAATSAQQHGDLATPTAAAAHPAADITTYLPNSNLLALPGALAAAAAATSATAAAGSYPLASQGDMLQLMRRVASALGGAGPTWDLLRSLNSSTAAAAAGPGAAAVNMMGLHSSVGMIQQQL